MSDEMVLVKIGESTVEVVKAVLTLSSPVFKAMLASGMKEAQENFIELSDGSRSEFETLVLFIHPATFHKQSVKETNLDFLLKWSDKYQIESVKDRCEEFLLKTPVTFSRLLQAHHYKLQTQLRRCLEDQFPQISIVGVNKLLKNEPTFMEDLVPHVAKKNRKCGWAEVLMLSKEAPTLVEKLFPVAIDKAREEADEAKILRSEKAKALEDAKYLEEKVDKQRKVLRQVHDVVQRLQGKGNFQAGKGYFKGDDRDLRDPCKELCQNWPGWASSVGIP